VEKSEKINTASSPTFVGFFVYGMVGRFGLTMKKVSLNKYIKMNYEFYSKRRKVVKEILNKKRSQKEMKFYCLFNTPYVTWRIYK